MQTRLLNIWDRFNGSFWFLPACLVVGAAALGFIFPMIDAKDFLKVRDNLPWLATTSEGARTVLSTIAGAMITVAGVVFSVTMVALSIASSQFGSRVLRQRMQNRVTQIALGAFLGTSVFCFLVLRTVQKPDHMAATPHLSVTVGLVLAVASLFVLIYFIHDVAEAVQAPHIAARIAEDLNDSIERLFPEKLGQVDTETEELDERWAPPRKTEPDLVIPSDREGYLQAIDGESLMEGAKQNDLLIEMCVRPGDFIAAEDPVAKIWSDVTESKKVAQLVNDALIVGNMRTPRQDLDCAIHELAQMTVRALSPGINDPFTAVNGIDRLSAAMGRLAQRKIPSRYRADDQGKLRLIADRITFPEALTAAFQQIRQNAKSVPPVGVRLLEGLESIARRARRRSDGEAILQEANMVMQEFQQMGHLDQDIRGLQEQLTRIRAVLIDGVLRPENGCTASGDAHDGREQTAEPTDNDSAEPRAAGEVNG